MINFRTNMMEADSEFDDEVPELGVLDPAGHRQHSGLRLPLIPGLKLLNIHVKQYFSLWLHRIPSLLLFSIRSDIRSYLLNIRLIWIEMYVNFNELY